MNWDATEARSQRVREGLREGGLTHSGHVLDQEMAATDQGFDGGPDHGGFAPQGLLDFLSQAEDLLSSRVCVRGGGDGQRATSGRSPFHRS